MLKFYFALSLSLLLSLNGYSQGLTLHLACLTDSIWKSHLYLEKVSVIMGDWNILAGDDTIYHDHRYQVYPFIDGSKENEYLIEINPIDLSRITSISFQLGVDSLTHYQEIGCCGLEPNNDMYWTWQSGYIGFKLEGTDHFKNKWKYHLGGFQWPFRADQKLDFSSPNTGDNHYQITLHLSETLFAQMNQSDFKVMSPNQQSNALMKLIANSFLIRSYHE